VPASPPEQVYSSATLSSLKALSKSGQHGTTVSLAKPSQHLASLSLTVLYAFV